MPRFLPSRVQQHISTSTLHRQPRACAVRRGKKTDEREGGGARDGGSRCRSCASTRSQRPPRPPRATCAHSALSRASRERGPRDAHDVVSAATASMMRVRAWIDWLPRAMEPHLQQRIAVPLQLEQHLPPLGGIVRFLRLLHLADAVVMQTHSADHAATSNYTLYSREASGDGRPVARVERVGCAGDARMTVDWRTKRTAWRVVRRSSHCCVK